VTPLESKAALSVLTEDAADTISWTLQRTSGSFESRRLQLIEIGSAVTGYYSEGSAALAVDFYDESRADARAAGRFATEPVILDRVVRIRRGLAWASEPLSVDDDAAALGRLTEIVKSEVVRPYRDTVLEARRRDPETAGWMRITSPAACSFCRFMAGKGAVYKKSSANFAAHDSCQCTAAPVFRGQAIGPEASALQYVGSKRRRTELEKQRLRDAVSAFELDS
jgi:hypothetical protein